MNALLLGPGENLMDAVAGRIGESGVALCDAAVVFPGKRPAHFLRQRLAEGRSSERTMSSCTCGVAVAVSAAVVGLPIHSRAAAMCK